LIYLFCVELVSSLYFIYIYFINYLWVFSCRV